MKKQMRAIVLSAIAMSLWMSGCTTQKVKNKVLLPAITMSSESIHELADKGVEGFPEADQAGIQNDIHWFFGEIDTGEGARVIIAYQTNWPIVHVSAKQGVTLMLSEGMIGEFVSQSLTEEIINFDKSLADYAE